MPQFCLTAFFCLFAMVVYALAGYPLLLRFVARRHHHPILKDNRLRSVSFIIPVHNGEKFLENKLSSILALNYPRELVEILVVSDGSTDRTDEIATRFARDGVRLIRVERGGKPAAINAAVPVSSGEILIFNDVRQTLHPESLRNLIACFGDPAVGAVSAQLSIRPGETSAEQDTGLYWRYELWIRQQMTRIHSTWGCTGAYYGMRRSLWTPIPADVLIDDAWLPLTAVLKGYRVILEPTAVMYDFPTALNSEFRRKVRTLAGLFQLIWLLPGLFSSRNPMRLHYLSGKYSRLIVPWCLIGMALVSFGMPEPWRMLALAGQGVFYFAGAIDSFVPGGSTLKKLTSPIRTFITLMAAALFAIRIFFVPPRSLWKETKVRETVQIHAD
jgi:cellulose synthase/poly-beta-1,6-N-acetylglucosamine synthase-like glycosyltransferase